MLEGCNEHIVFLSLGINLQRTSNLLIIAATGWLSQIQEKIYKEWNCGILVIQSHLQELPQ